MELIVNFFDRIDSAYFWFTNLTLTLLHMLVALRLIGSLYVHFTYININIFANFDDCTFKLIVIYSVGVSGKFSAIMMTVVLILQYLDFQAFNIFLQVATHSLLDS